MPFSEWPPHVTSSSLFLSPTMRPATKRPAPATPAPTATKKSRPSSYTKYCWEQRPLLPAGLRNAQREQLLGTRWKVLPEAEKAVYRFQGALDSAPASERPTYVPALVAYSSSQWSARKAALLKAPAPASAPAPAPAPARPRAPAPYFGYHWSLAQASKERPFPSAAARQAATTPAPAPLLMAKPPILAHALAPSVSVVPTPRASAGLELLSTVALQHR